MMMLSAACKQFPCVGSVCGGGKKNTRENLILLARPIALPD